MTWSTAIRHLTEMADTATEHLPLRASEIGWPLEELWVTGALLGPDDELDSGAVILVVDLPADELSWLAVHPTAEWIGEQLRLGRRPMSWCYRPATWPAWSCRHKKVLRFWSAADGPNQLAIESLRSGQPIDIVEPSADELVGQLQVELAASRRHLRAILDQYWDHDWRHSVPHRTTPEDLLWRAATAVTEIESALAEHTAR